MLGVNPGASEEEIKKAYRDLAKQWHPDQYANTPRYDEAMERMKQINTAYDTLTGKNADQHMGGGYQGYGNPFTQGFGGEGYGSAEGDYADEATMRARVRAFIHRGDFRTAEQVLTRLSERTAEWYFLMGCVLASTGRYDAARIHLTQAVEMDPGNKEFRDFRDQFEKQGPRFKGRAFGSGNQRETFCRIAQCMLLSSFCAGTGGLGSMWPLLCFCR